MTEDLGRPANDSSRPRLHKLVVVEDDPDLYPIFNLELRERRGYEVSIVAAAEELLARFSDLNPDLVILDYCLAGEMNGLSALRHLQEIGANTPVVMLTSASNFEELRGECIRAGGYDLFSKPVVDWDLLDFRIQKAAENAANQHQLSLLTAADKAKRAFLRLIGHEFGTPMTPLISGLHELLDPDIRTGEDAEEIIRDALAGAERLNELIGSILDIVEIRDGKFALDMVPIPLAEVVGMAADAISIQATRKNLKLTTEILSTAEVQADPARLKQAFFELLDNAVKFTEQGGITVKVWDENDKVLVSFTDTGCGISEQKLPGIFGLFKQVDDSISRSVNGAGIGLTLAQELVRLHHGSIHAESAVGKGSSFTATLQKAGDR